VESVSGFEYYLVCLDDFTQYAWVFPLLSKSEAFTHLSSLHALALTQFHASFQAIQCDNGREFDNSFFSCPYTSQQNGKAERIICTLNNITRTLLIQASMPPHY
jgi:hypothetical protein